MNQEPLHAPIESGQKRPKAAISGQYSSCPHRPTIGSRKTRKPAIRRNPPWGKRAAKGKRYIEALRAKSQQHSLRVLGCCLMTNHVHLGRDPAAPYLAPSLSTLCSSEEVVLEAKAEEAGKRLDRFLTEQLPESSRARIQAWIRDGRVTIDGAPAKASLRLRGGESIDVRPAPAPPLKAFPEAIDLDILYEDGDLAAVNKPAGMTVHAGAGKAGGTLVNALLHHFGSLSKVGGDVRPGIVHRLDRMTSGVLLVAKNDQAHRRLARQFQSRKVRKIYWAIVEGDAARSPEKGRPVELDGQRWTRLEMPISRDPRRRIKMAARRQGRTALSDFRALRRLGAYSLVEVRIGTGRTHQIRVHLAAVGHPVLGDTLYGAARRPPGMPELSRFYLHAREIGFAHPTSGEAMTIEAPLPDDFSALIDSPSAV